MRNAVAVVSAITATLLSSSVAIADAPDAVSYMSAGGITFSYENFQKTRTGSLELILKFTNPTDRSEPFAVAECALLDGQGRAVSVQNIAVRDVPARGHAYGKTYFMTPGEATDVSCRLT